MHCYLCEDVLLVLFEYIFNAYTVAVHYKTTSLPLFGHYRLCEALMPIISGNLFKPYTVPVVKVNVMSISSACIMEPIEFATSNYTISVEMSVFLAYTERT